MDRFRPGMSATLTHEVTADDAATRWANDAEVLATPVLLWLGEVACMRAIENALSPGKMTVGAAHSARHLAATPVGWVVTVEATLAEVRGRRLTFRVAANDGREAILEGTHDRFVLDATEFKAGVEDKARNRPVAQEARS
ncbi:MAG TPA: hotdog domain-containing protein [Actinomycetota bacterium]|nr:hotdog domain-containing protein [Actinomycetota bacterium]